MSDQLPNLTNKPIPDLTDLLYLVEPGIEPSGSFNILISQLRAFLLSGVPVAFPPDTSEVGNVGAGLDLLDSFSLPADSLANDEDFLDVWYGGVFANNANAKLIQAEFGGTAYETGGGLVLTGGASFVGWSLNIRIIRLSSTSVRVSHGYIAHSAFISVANAPNTFGAGSFVVSRSSDITGLANLNSNATDMELFGQGTADDDVVKNLRIIRLTQF